MISSLIRCELCARSGLGEMARRNSRGVPVMERTRAFPYLFLCSLVFVGPPAHHHTHSKIGATESHRVQERRDGQRDFDFSIGTWKTHVSRLLRPLTGSTTWAEYDGISVVRRVWKGGANLLELDVSGPAGHIEGAGLRLYNPQSRQWSLNWVSSSDGILNRPVIGDFQGAQGEFFDQESFGGRAIFVRNRFSDI